MFYNGVIVYFISQTKRCFYCNKRDENGKNGCQEIWNI